MAATCFLLMGSGKALSSPSDDELATKIRSDLKKQQCPNDTLAHFDEARTAFTAKNVARLKRIAKDNFCDVVATIMAVDRSMSNQTRALDVACKYLSRLSAELETSIRSATSSPGGGNPALKTQGGSHAKPAAPDRCPRIWVPSLTATAGNSTGSGVESLRSNTTATNPPPKPIPKTSSCRDFGKQMATLPPQYCAAGNFCTDIQVTACGNHLRTCVSETGAPSMGMAQGVVDDMVRACGCGPTQVQVSTQRHPAGKPCMQDVVFNELRLNDQMRRDQERKAVTIAARMAIERDTTYLVAQLQGYEDGPFCDFDPVDPPGPSAWVKGQQRETTVRFDRCAPCIVQVLRNPSRMLPASEGSCSVSAFCLASDGRWLKTYLGQVDSDDPTEQACTVDTDRKTVEIIEQNDLDVAFPRLAISTSAGTATLGANGCFVGNLQVIGPLKDSVEMSKWLSTAPTLWMGIRKELERQGSATRR